MQIDVALTLSREAASVPLVRNAVSTILGEIGFDPDCRIDVELALSEACTNVIVHATDSEDFRVVVGLEDDWLTLEVTDSGPGFAADTPSATMPGPWAGKGRGTALITALTDTAVFDNLSGGAAVHMTKHMTWLEGSSFRGRTSEGPKARP